tara:strand:- start:482 stop:1195 length:714 start_codon:yes stop_codon:yes gene_type:complete
MTAQNSNIDYTASLEHFDRFRRENLRLFQAIPNFDDIEIIDRCHTTALLGHHIFDWVAMDKGLSKNKFRDWRTSILSNNKSLAIFHDLCTNSKHAITSNPQSTVNDCTFKTTVIVNEEAALFKEIIKKPYQFKNIIAGDLIQKVPKVGGINFLRITRNVEKFWTNFFSDNGCTIDQIEDLPKDWGMITLKFIKDFSFYPLEPQRHYVQHYTANSTALVTRECAEKALQEECAISLPN